MAANIEEAALNGSLWFFIGSSLNGPLQVHRCGPPVIYQYGILDWHGFSPLYIDFLIYATLSCLFNLVFNAMHTLSLKCSGLSTI